MQFDDARMAKAAFEKQDSRAYRVLRPLGWREDSRRTGLLEYEDFVQDTTRIERFLEAFRVEEAVLELHRNINETCTAVTPCYAFVFIAFQPLVASQQP